MFILRVALCALTIHLLSFTQTHAEVDPPVFVFAVDSSGSSGKGSVTVFREAVTQALTDKEIVEILETCSATLSFVTWNAHALEHARVPAGNKGAAENFYSQVMTYWWHTRDGGITYPSDVFKSAWNKFSQRRITILLFLDPKDEQYPAQSEQHKNILYYGGAVEVFLSRPGYVSPNLPQTNVLLRSADNYIGKMRVILRRGCMHLS